MVRIRLRRVGARNQPSYRIVVAEKESPRDGRFLEIIGHYNPRTEPSTIVVDEDRLYHWLGNGASPSDSVTQILKQNGSWDRWLRLKDGDDRQKLLEEAAEARVEVDPRTRRDDILEQLQAKKADESEPAEEEKPEKPEEEPEEEEVAEEEVAEEVEAEEEEEEEKEEEKEDEEDQEEE